MKKTLLLLALLLSLVVTSCSPRIYGAKPHRRDRNCGCEIQHPCDKTYQNDCTNLM